MTPAQARKVVEQAATRSKRRKSVDLHALTFGPQRDFVLDKSPYVAASCSRQAGKSYGIALKLIDRAFDYPGKTCLYITNTKPQARSILWNVLKELDESLNLGGKFQEVTSTYYLPNKAVIQLGGANDENEIERYRGPQYPLVVIDEAQSIRPFIRYLIYQIIRPGQAKYPDGQIVIAGTPNAPRSGMLYDVASGKEEAWSVHHWTILDNPHIPNKQAFLALECKTRGITPADATYQREYEGKWVRDAASQAYQINDSNIIDAFPTDIDDWQYVLGVDLGFTNVTAFVVLAYSISAGRAVVAESYQVTPPEGDNMLTPEFLASHITSISDHYAPTSIVVDPGGLGAAFIKELRQRFGLPLIAAEKQRKLAAIELLNGDLRTGRLMVVRESNADLIHDASLLQLNWKRADGSRHGGNIRRADLVIDDRTPDHLTDALTYAYREARHFLYEDDDSAPPPPIGSPAYYAALEAQLDEQAIEAAEKDTGPDGWLYPDDDPVDDPLDVGGFFYRVILSILRLFDRVKPWISTRQSNSFSTYVRPAQCASV